MIRRAVLDRAPISCIPLYSEILIVLNRRRSQDFSRRLTQLFIRHASCPSALHTSNVKGYHYSINFSGSFFYFWRPLWPAPCLSHGLLIWRLFRCPISSCLFWIRFRGGNIRWRPLLLYAPIRSNLRLSLSSQFGLCEH